MKVLIYSPAFYPSIGGLETLVAMLAEEFVRQGHEVKLVTLTPATGSRGFPFEVIRQPSARRLLSLMRWCEVYFQPQLSLKGVWPLLLNHRPWVVAHNTWYSRPDGRLAWQDHLKHFLIRFATGISVSQSIAGHVASPSKVIPNAYREETFYLMPDVARDKELIFLGRLVSDKGVDLLLDALSRLKAEGLTPSLTVVGSGPEENELRRLAAASSVRDQVEFAGALVGEELARALNSHKILVAPSRWKEPFGIVALEGIACGCVVVGSEGGGLKDAIGPCGVTFPNGDVAALTEALCGLLAQPERLAVFRNGASSHLARHRRADVAGEYLGVFKAAVEGAQTR